MVAIPIVESSLDPSPKSHIWFPTGYPTALVTVGTNIYYGTLGKNGVNALTLLHLVDDN